MRVKLSAETQYIVALLLVSGVSISLLGAEMIADNSKALDYLVWNLFLAWIPFLLSLRLVRVLRHKLWSSWEVLLLSAAWLIFLPNAFYVASDLIHLTEVGKSNLLLSAVMLAAFVYTAMLLGLSSLYLVHLEFQKRLSSYWTAATVGVILFTCSIAIYIGRDLRWNSWDILTSPAGILFDLSARMLQPDQYLQIFLVILPFFMLLMSAYVSVWYGLKVARRL